MSDDSKAIDALLEASEAHAKEIQKLHGICCALTVVCTALLEQAGLRDEKDLARLQNSMLFFRLPDAQVEAAQKALQLLWGSRGQ